MNHFIVKIDGKQVFAGSKYLCHCWAAEQDLETLEKSEMFNTKGVKVKDVQISLHKMPNGETQSYRGNPLLKRALALKRSVEHKLAGNKAAREFIADPVERYKAMQEKATKEEPKVEPKAVKEELKVEPKTEKKNRVKPNEKTDLSDKQPKDMDKGELQDFLTRQGVEYHHKAGKTKLLEILNKHLEG